MIRKLIKSLRFGRKKDRDPLEGTGDDETDDVSDILHDVDVPFGELPVEVQWERLPKRPPSRRWWLSKLLIIALFLSPIGAVSVGLIPILDPETGWRLFHMGSPKTIAAVPGSERELQEEIAKGVRDVEERTRAEQEALANAGADQPGEPQNAEDIARQLEGVSDLVGTPGQDGTPDGSTTPTPEELAALAEEGALDQPIDPDPLRPAPIPGLDEEGSFGRIPRIADDGTTPFDAYKRPFDIVDGQPYVGIIVTGVGLNSSRTRSAIEELPLNISLALSPYSNNLPQVAADARAMGHEVFLQLPMEPIDFPLSDPGPRALLTSLPEGENLVRLEWLLARFPGYAGVVSYLGSKFGSLDSAIRPVIEFVDRTGLMYVEGTNSGSISLGAQLAANTDTPNAIGNIMIDDIPSRRQIDARLADLVEQAKSNGVAIGIAQSYPVTIQRLRNWAARLGRQGVQLAPVSALANRQVTPQSADEAEAARQEAAEAEARAQQNDAPAEADDGAAETIEN
ncbi:divergent polysaccharide deacetylase family protein [Thalassospira australica]|uniref:divergent polysaccharide deacetylase family protein n=1 Tax=Thalassospira australica TaxID=1528106 RepID=UPI00384A4A8C